MVEARFTVNLLAPIPEALRTTVALQLAEKFNVSIAKMNRLLNVQGPITKPISQRDAKKIAKVLGQAGVEVAIVRSDLDKVLLIAEEPLVTRQDRLELRELLSDLPTSSPTLPLASRLEEPALVGKQVLGESNQDSTKQVFTLPTRSKPLSRPMIVAVLSLVFVVLTVAFGVSFILPGRERLSPFEQGMAASTTGDYAKALGLWQSLADGDKNAVDNKGDMNAQFEVAWLYTNGLGTPKNLEQAAFYFGKAAAQGHVEAQYKLGQLYLYGQGVAQDYAQAVIWLSAAAEQGSGEAQLTLGRLYVAGEGIPINLNEADKWLNLAAKQGVKGANEALSNLMRLQAVAKVAGSHPDVFAAVEQGDAQAVIGAVLAGADVNVRSKDGYTPLMYAVTKGNLEVVSEVLSGGADVNAQSATGWTALMFAAKNSPTMISVLLEKGADKTLKNSTGQTAYDVAMLFQASSAMLLSQ
jgi:TPR repeat protein